MEKRPVCQGCDRPIKVCYCSGLPNPKLLLKCNIVIYQDPREDKQAFSSVRLLSKSIQNLEVFVTTKQKGRKFPEIQLPNPVLLYPSKTASTVLPENIETLILIDATWKFAKSIYKKNAWFSSIPTVMLKPVSEPIYSALRLPPKAGLVSTAEALIIMLENINDISNANDLRKALQYTVEVEHWQKSHYDLKYSNNL